MHRAVLKSALGIVLMAVIMAAPADAAGLLDARLVERLQAMEGPQEVVITFSDRTGIARLQSEIGAGVIALDNLSSISVLSIRTATNWRPARRSAIRTCSNTTSSRPAHIHGASPDTSRCSRTTR